MGVHFFKEVAVPLLFEVLGETAVILLEIGRSVAHHCSMLKCKILKHLPCFLRPLLARFHGEKFQSHDFGMTSGSSGATRKKGWGMT